MPFNFFLGGRCFVCFVPKQAGAFGSFFLKVEHSVELLVRFLLASSGGGTYHVVHAFPNGNLRRRRR